MLTYLDTSAAMKLVFEEQESESIADHLAHDLEGTLVASWLLHTELRCAAGRRGEPADALLSAVLRLTDLVDVTRGDLIAAGALAPLRAQDAIHLATAMRLGVDAMITYDRELAAAAARADIRVVMPGAVGES